MAAEELEDQARIALAAHYLVTQQKDDGLFHYRFDFLSGRYSDDDNMVRQAGTAYALADYLQFSEDPIVHEAVQRAISALERASIQFSDGLIVGPGPTEENAKTGSTALALLALISFQSAGGEGFEGLRQKWRTGLRALWLNGRGFAKEPNSPETSPYYDGEAWLALALDARLFGDADPEFLARVDETLMHVYGQTYDGSFFHWGAKAAAQRYLNSNGMSFVDFSITQLESFLADQPQMHPAANSCYTVEGLASTLAIVPDYFVAPDWMLDANQRIGAEMEKARALQLQPGQTRFPFSSGGILTSAQLGDHAGAFMAGFDQAWTRIDFTQHCLSALLHLSGRL